ncbi:MAG: 30S ribosomal protein S8 [Bacteroidetes bacterium GWF2_43_63]|nr:MAG: 30S ribosomal protein S8 [Bacteroidetes bacterium GWE2_42_42]OFY55820.1 MAG: 30S ribosomal protein S8 [Bacteroidetes bacterium GWF2_43_63]HBG71259.1 30S ribosomal protein S8 [Bacteroidales bacterium]HCB60520.1 30S ribosomal protein S8 [Bacteroidales bacterium]HCY22523.1 30S ribosomal protein S8 [Bacteroidales bacterium]
MVTDSIADFLTRVRNAIKANHRIVEVPSNKMLVELAKLLHENGYILNYKVEESTFPKSLKVALKYNPINKLSAITEIKRVSRPGLRKYSPSDEIPKVMNGLGIAIVSTSKGLMTDKQARKENVGGEVICFVS